MIINKYNVQLTRLTKEDIELVREKRNSEAIREKMVYQKKVSSDQQLEWFDSIDNINNIYFLIHFEGKKIGVINGKNADFVNRTSEGGIFIWDENYLNSIVPSLCAIIMHDYNFHICEFEKTFIKVLRNNTVAINFNKLIGYKIDIDNLSKPYLECSIHRDYYYDKITKYRNAIGKMYNDYEPLNKEDFSFEGVSDEDLRRYFGELPEYLIEKVNSVLIRENRNLL